MAKSKVSEILPLNLGLKKQKGNSGGECDWLLMSCWTRAGKNAPDGLSICPEATRIKVWLRISLPRQSKNQSSIGSEAHFPRDQKRNLERVTSPVGPSCFRRMRFRVMTQDSTALADTPDSCGPLVTARIQLPLEAY